MQFTTPKTNQTGVKNRWRRIFKRKFPSLISGCRACWTKSTIPSFCESKAQTSQILCVSWTLSRWIWTKWSWRRGTSIGTRRPWIWAWWSHSTTSKMPKSSCHITSGYGAPFTSGTRTFRSGKCLLLRTLMWRRSLISHRSTQEQSYYASATCQREAQLCSTSRRWCLISKQPCPQSKHWATKSSERSIGRRLRPS